MPDNLPDPFTFAQLIGWASFVLFFISYQVLDSKKTLLLWVPARFLMALHFCLLHSYVAFGVTLGAAFRDLISFCGTRKATVIFIVFHLVFSVLLCALIGEHLEDYLIVIGTVGFSLSSYYKDHFWKQRLFSILSQILWVVSFILIGSYAGLATILFTLSSNIIGMVRYKMRASSTTS